MMTNEPIANHAEMERQPGRRLEPCLMVFTTLQFVLAFVAHYCRAGYPTLALVLATVPVGATFLATLGLCVMYTRQCRLERSLAFYLMSFFAAIITPGAILFLTTVLMTLLPGE